MRVAVGLAGLAGLTGLLAVAGCANPYAMPPPSRVVLVPAVPRYQPPPVVFQPNVPPPAAEVVAPKVPDEEPAAVVEPAPAATVVAPTPATAPVAVQKATVPESGTAVPMMGFRPMKGQKAPGASTPGA